ncbi:MAG: Crp/Fnr family transcriptional regulator [Chloroflexi bacterium]|nr:Crp/Fnr family transcriptional regulator [Chloroflexota bacterium]
MDPNKLMGYLERLPLFQGAPQATLAKLTHKVQILNLVRGDFLAHQGDASDSLFVIRTGWIKIVAEGPQGEEVILNQCGPGQLIGEMSLIDQKPRSNSMIAISQAEVLEIKYDAVLAVLNEYPLLALSFLRDMSDRLRFANAYIEETIVWSQHIASGNYDFVQKRVEETQSTIVSTDLSYQARANAFLSSFFKMVEGVKKREEDLKKQVQQLTIEIDEVKRQKAVKELTESEFFENLQTTAQRIREERAAKEQKRPE